MELHMLLMTWCVGLLGLGLVIQRGFVFLETQLMNPIQWTGHTGIYLRLVEVTVTLV
jgi:hypothetical protein